MKVVKLLFSESNAVFIFRDEKIKKESNDLPGKGLSRILPCI